MDTVSSFSGDGLYGSAETLNLPPQWHQAGHVVVEINHRHLSVWMHLGRRREKRERQDGSADYTHSLITDKVCKM